MSNDIEKSRNQNLSSFIVFEYVKQNTTNSDNKRQQQQTLFVIEIRHRNNETLQ